MNKNSMNKTKDLFYIFLITLFATTFPQMTNAKETFGSLKVSKVIRVIDGDTFVAEIENVHPIIGKNISIRIAGIDTPELSYKKGATQNKSAILAKAFLSNTLRSADTIQLKRVSRGRYFRLVADVYADGINVGDKLLKHSHAKVWKPRRVLH
jgi:micrococcal nuclease